jgi:hypothetical protein
MAKFAVKIDEQPDTVRIVGAGTVRKAVSLYWNERVVEGMSSAAGRARLVVRHPDGPSVDPSAIWYMKDGAVFAMVDVQVASVEVAMFEVDARKAMREQLPEQPSALDALERRVRGWVGIRD